MREIDFIIIHCSDSPDDRDVRADEIDRWHKERGWKCIGYHYVICRDGVIEKGRDEDDIGSHCQGYNSNSIGICLVGGVYGRVLPNSTNDINHFNPNQINSLKQLISELLVKYPNAKIKGHRDFNPDKTCPNFDVSLLEV